MLGFSSAYIMNLSYSGIAYRIYAGTSKSFVVK